VHTLSKADVLSWFAAFPASRMDYVQCDEHGLFFAHPEANCIDIEYPQKLEQLPFLARLLATVGYEPKDFEGALLWFTTWGVWNSSDEAPGYQIIEAMNRAAGQSSSFEVAPGHDFRADELTHAIAMLLQPMLFGWDAYYYPRWSYGTGEFFLFISHDSFVSVVTRTAAFYDEVRALLEELGFHPKEGHALQKERFCRVS
jgi:hypothetical protein